MKIFIPTRGRVEDIIIAGKPVSVQFTWDALSDEAKSYTTLVCPEEEVEGHLRKGRKAIARPSYVKNLSQSRQWMVENFKDPKTLMLDDDLKFFRRIKPEAYNLERVYKEDVDPVLKNVMDGLDTFAHVGLSPRQMNQKHFPARWIHVFRINAVLGVDARVLLQENIRYDEVTVMADYHVHLSLLERGYANRVFVAGAWDQKLPSGSPGGCSIYRTKDSQEAGAYRLKELHPESVEVVKKVPKVGWDGDLSGERTDVTIYWKKAFKQSGLDIPEDIV